jgi:hypothetical protein
MGVRTIVPSLIRSENIDPAIAFIRLIPAIPASSRFFLMDLDDGFLIPVA